MHETRFGPSSCKPDSEAQTDSGGILLLTGQTEQHLRPCWSGALVHQQVLAPLQRLRQRAAAAGFDLAIASSFRGFERQQLIWQDKVAGRRPVLSCSGEQLDPQQLDGEALLWAILRWSALPGTSRHHWGTDLDVYDANAIDADYQLQLVPQEYARGGPFYDFQCWLEACVAEGRSEGFYHPYAQDFGAVAPEPWHISYRPLADQLQQQFDYTVFRQLLQSGSWSLTEEIERHAEDIFQRFVQLQC